MASFNPQEKQHVQHVLNILNAKLLATTKNFGEALELRTTVHSGEWSLQNENRVETAGSNLELRTTIHRGERSLQNENRVETGGRNLRAEDYDT
jgi:hypothetical protein